MPLHTHSQPSPRRMFLRIKAVGVNWFSLHRILFFSLSPPSLFLFILFYSKRWRRGRTRYFAIPLSRFSNALIGIIEREGGKRKREKGIRWSAEIVVFKLQREIDRFFRRNDRVVTSLSIGRRGPSKLSIRDLYALRAAFYAPRQFAASFQSV